MPRARQSFSKPSAVKQLPRSVSTWVTWKGKAASAASSKARALASVSSSLTARWTERERRSMATNRNRLRHVPSAVRGSQLGQVLHVQIHPYMLRHACGFALAHDRHDTRAIQEWLGHRNIQHTTHRFKDFWQQED